MTWESWLFMFVGSFVLDVLWTTTVVAIAHESAVKAATWGMATTVTGDVLILGLVQDPWLLIPIGIGAWLGIFAPKWWAGRKNVSS
jgi:hypothetical protein